VLRHLSDLEDEDGSKPAPGYRSVALALIVAIWSMGVRYRGALNVIARQSPEFGLPQGAVLGDDRQDGLGG
jgi:hypothetical protein